MVLGLLASACSDGSSDTSASSAADTEPDEQASAEQETVDEQASAEQEAVDEPAPAAAPTEVATELEPESIYDAPGGLELPLPLEPGAPGDIIATESIALSGGTGERFLYHSTSTAGEDIAVSGFLAVPDGEPPAGGWPLVAWAHGTVGIGDSCAPSANAENDLLASALLNFGFAVVATDYEGCLLYTSPSPRDATLSRMPSSA